MNRTAFYIYVVTAICWIFCYSAWMWYGRTWFEVGTAFGMFGATLAARSGVKYKFMIPFTSFICYVAFSNLIDELFFDPTKIEAPEYIAGLSVFIYLHFIKKYK